MSCQTLHDALIDLARGLPAGTGTRAAIQSHIDHCPACAALFFSELELTGDLRGLASACAVGPSPATGQRIMQAFDAMTARHAPLSIAGGDPRRVLAAAMVIVGAGAAWIAWSVGSAPVKPPEVRRGGPAGPGRGVDVHLARTAAPPEAPSVPAVAPAGRGRRPRAATSRPKAESAGDAVMSGFQPVPGAIGLPDLESGSIVRVELPMTALAAYGVDIVPDPARAEVQADLLVGQDGHARAIRVVVSESESRSRQ
jgi:hypothetical protein